MNQQSRTRRAPSNLSTIATVKDIHTGNDPEWYRDAVIYQLHVKSFFDSNDDGTGDFAGLLR
jgi:pullulanase/glycogen debranching enzyme